jgi:hypothetical protein
MSVEHPLFAGRRRDHDAFSLSVATMTDEVLAAEAAEDRRARRLNRLVERESSTMTGVLVELAERRVAAVIEVAGGLTVRGLVTAVGSDVVVLLSSNDRRRSIVRMQTIGSLRISEASEITGDRPGSLAANFQDTLAQLAGVDEIVTMFGSSGPSATGTLIWVGADVACLSAGNHSTDKFTYVALGSLTAVVTA